MEGLAELPVEQLQELAVQVLEILESVPTIGRGGKPARPWEGGLERNAGIPNVFPEAAYGGEMRLGAVVETERPEGTGRSMGVIGLSEPMVEEGVGTVGTPLIHRKTRRAWMQQEPEGEEVSGIPTRRADRRVEDRSVRRDAEAISAFLRRDSRRYDAGFVHY